MVALKLIDLGAHPDVGSAAEGMDTCGGRWIVLSRLLLREDGCFTSRNRQVYAKGELLLQELVDGVRAHIVVLQMGRSVCHGLGLRF